MARSRCSTATCNVPGTAYRSYGHAYGTWLARCTPRRAAPHLTYTYFPVLHLTPSLNTPAQVILSHTCWACTACYMCSTFKFGCDPGPGSHLVNGDPISLI